MTTRFARISVQLCFLTLFTACSGLEDKKIQVDGSPGGAELNPDLNQLRLDVYPGEDQEDLLPQTWIADGGTDWTGMLIDVKPAITVTGQVVGYAVSPFHADVPGSELSPVDATIRITRPGTISGGSIKTDEVGNFSVQIPPARDYTLSIVPTDSTLLPFAVIEDLDIVEDLDIGQVDLGYGLPVYGQITDGDGRPVSDAEVRLQHATTGIQGPSRLTDSTGHYLLRASEGEYFLRIEGTPGVALPTLQIPGTVDSKEGLELDVNVGRIETTSIVGQIKSLAGNLPIRNVKVRLSSDSLTGSTGQLVIETESDKDGLFSRQLLPGTWVAEFIPEYDDALGSLEMTFSVGSNGDAVDLGTIQLPSKVEISAVIRDPDGNPIEGAAINARELGFDGYIFATSTGPNGLFSVDVPPHAIALSISPPTADFAVTNELLNPLSYPGDFTLSPGELIEGTVVAQGDPLPFTLLEIRDLSGALYATTFTDPDGNFAVRLEGL
jgi:hypothetical protein